ncbi:hypothetical protein [Actinokineospora sp.]|uniref:hypothetical protein n=1 Tax=Actinokineospora sp. TaxID=1872133 RepID=UPI003D6AF47E
MRLHIDSGAVADEQILTYRWAGNHAVTWSLERSRTLRSLHGAYVLSPVPGGTEVTHILLLDPRAQMLGALKPAPRK